MLSSQLSANQKSDVHNQADVRSQANIEAQNAKQNTPVISRAPGSSQAGSPAYSSTNPKGNTGTGYGGGKITFDAKGNTLLNGQIIQFAGRQAQESYLAERGYGNNYVVTNQAKAANADFSNLANPNLVGVISDSGRAAIPIPQPVAPKLNPSENYGYTSKVAPIIANNFVKNPLEANFELAKTKPATQARNTFRSQFSPDQGGVTTAKSKGKSEGVNIISANQYYRNSPLEDQAKVTQAKKAEGIYKNPANTEYALGGGNPANYVGKKFTKTDTSLLPSIDARKASEALRAKIYPSGAKVGYEYTTLSGLVDKSAIKNASDIFRSTGGQGTSISDVFNYAAKSGISNINIYDVSTGAKIGTVKADKSGLQAVNLLSTELGPNQTISVRPEAKSTRADFSNLQSLADKGALITLYQPTNDNTLGRPIGIVSGSNASFSILKLTKGGQNAFQYTYVYPKKEQALLSSIKNNPSLYLKNPKILQSAIDKGFLDQEGLNKVQDIYKSYIKEQTTTTRQSTDLFTGKTRTITTSINQANLLKSVNPKTELPGVSFNIFDKNGKIISNTSGPRSRYDITKEQNKNPDITYNYKDSYTVEQFLNYNSANAKLPSEINKTKNLDSLSLLSPISLSANKNVQDISQSIGQGSVAAVGGLVGLGESLIEPFITSKNNNPFSNQTLGNQTKSSLEYLATLGYKVGPIIKPELNFIQRNTVPNNPMKTISNILLANVPPESVKNAIFKNTKFESKPTPYLSKFGQDIIKKTAVPSNLEAVNLGRENATQSYGYYAGQGIFSAVMGGLMIGSGVTTAIGLKGAILRPNAIIIPAGTTREATLIGSPRDVPNIITIYGKTIGTGKYAVGVGMKSSEGTKIPYFSSLNPKTDYMSQILKNLNISGENGKGLGLEVGSLTDLTVQKVFNPKAATTLENQGIISKEQNIDLINLTRTIAKKGDISKLPEQQIPKSQLNKMIDELNLTGNTEVNASLIKTLGENQAKSTTTIGTTIKKLTNILSSTKQLTSGAIVPNAGGSFANILPINFFNKTISLTSAKQYATFFEKSGGQFPYFKPEAPPIPVRPVSSIGDIDMLLNRNKKNTIKLNEKGEQTFSSKIAFQKQAQEDVLQSNKILDLLKKIKVPQGFGFAKTGKTNIGYGVEGKPTNEVLNLLGIRDEIGNTGVSGLSQKFTFGRWFGITPSSKTVRQGGIINVNSISYQGWAKAKSVISLQSKESSKNYPASITPEQAQATANRFGANRFIVNPANKRLKDVADLYSIARYGERTTTGKTSQRFGQLATNLQKHFTNVDWSVLENQEFNLPKSERVLFKQEQKILNPPSEVAKVSKNALISSASSVNSPSSAFSHITSYKPSSASIFSSKSSTFSSKSPSSSYTSSKFSPSSKSSSSKLPSSKSSSPSSKSSSSKTSSSSSSFSSLSPSIKSPSSKSSTFSSLSPSIKSPSISPSPSSPSPGSSLSPSSLSRSSVPFRPLNPTPSTVFSNPFPKILLPPLGAYPKRPRYRPKEGPTRIFKYNVNNIFASSLSLRGNNFAPSRNFKSTSKLFKGGNFKL